MSDRLDDEARLDWLQLARCDGIGPASFAKLLGRFGSAARALDALPGLIARWGAGERLRMCPRDVAKAEFERLRAAGCRLIARCEADYPPLLATIHDPPPVITVRGDPAHLHRETVALVGARNASGNGRMLARDWAFELARDGLVVVSGLARGIDTAAHEGAFHAGGTTVAVIASGVDVVYPEENRALHERIAAEGAIVSERPMGAIAKARHFPKRNRIIAGLARGVVVIEAAPQSGSLITARLAAEQGREVMAVPGSPQDARHRGTNRLLREGAALVESASDVQEVLCGLPALSSVARSPVAMPSLALSSEAMSSEAMSSEAMSAATRSPAETPPVRTVSRAVEVVAVSDAAVVDLATDDALARRLLARLGPAPLAVDELVRQCDASASDVQQALFELELVGRVERHPGNRVARIQAHVRAHVRG